MNTRTWWALLASALLAGCNDPSSLAPPTTSDEQPLFAKPGGGDPTSTWRFPLADAGLSVKGDTKYSDGTYSVYANGVCGVSGGFFYGATASPEAGVPTPNSRSRRHNPRSR